MTIDCRLTRDVIPGFTDRRDAYSVALEASMKDAHARTYENGDWQVLTDGITISLQVKDTLPGSEVQRLLRDFNYFAFATAALDRHKVIMDHKANLVVMDAWTGQVIASVLAQVS